MGRRAARRTKRRGENGLTLIELLVALAIMGLIATSIAGAFLIGLHVVGTRGDQVSLKGNNDLLAFEQQLGKDIARADCLRASGAPPAGFGQQPIPTSSGGTVGCQSSVYRSPTSTCQTGYLVCLAWYAPGTLICDTVTYSEGSGFIVRTDSVTGTQQRVSTGDLHVAAGWSTVTTPAPGHNTWTNLVVVQVDQLVSVTGIPSSKLASTTFRTVPRSDDPLAQLAGATVPC
jgi:prepilin-type N-terminal cleavage/methylation domain-containing protein